MSSACDHVRHEPVAPDTVREAMARAEARCLAKGERWTPPRQRVMELLLTAGRPVKPYDLMPGFADGRTAKPMTVYRALEFLDGMDLIHRITSLGAYVACAREVQAHGAAFLICQCCGGAEEFEPRLDEAAGDAAQGHGFALSAMILEVVGLCRACRPA